MRWFLGMICCFWGLASASAEVPQQLHYNGFLTNAVGLPIDCPDAVQCTENYDLTFRLYTSAEGGSPIWNEIEPSVAIYSGSFHSLLGDATPVTAELLQGPIWITVKVNDSAEMLPRQKLVSAAYAIRAGTVDYAENAAQLGGLEPGEYSTGPHTVDTDTQLTEAQVDAMVANNDYAIGPHTVDTDTQLTEEQVDAMVANNDYAIGPHTVNTDTQLSEEQVDEMVSNNGYAQHSFVVDTQVDQSAALSAETNARIAADQTILAQLGNAGVPAGVIVMWSGSPESVPTGWALCDGSLGTPDLKDRFIVGAGPSYSVGDTGGPTGGVSVTIGSGGGHEGVATSCVKAVSGGAGVPPYYALAFIMKL